METKPVLSWWDVIWRMGTNRASLNPTGIRLKTHYVVNNFNGTLECVMVLSFSCGFYPELSVEK